ncbi:MAG: tetraacyldisaccharide 4'-kinase [Burkholderiaceae bacterium]
MTPSVLEILTHRLADRLWRRWFTGACKSPGEVHLRPPANRLEQIRQRRAYLLDHLLWALLQPLLPWLGRITAWVARRRLRRQLEAPRAPSGQSIAVGNWVAGGGGKTPLCIALAIELRARGLAPAILSRGYRARAADTEQAPAAMGGRIRVLQPECLSRISPAAAGDEAWLMAWRTGCPVGVGADRADTARAVLSLYPHTNVWLLDDGLSQTSLRPDHRILVLDARCHGNGKPMPDGPLRGSWPPPAGHTPDTIVAPAGMDISQITADLPDHQPSCIARDTRPAQWLRFSWNAPDEDTRKTPSTPLEGDIAPEPEALAITDGPLPQGLAENGPFLAMAGIAQPDVFFDMLRDLGLPLADTLRLPDHAPEILPALLRWKAAHPLMATPGIVMTEKDAVKFQWEVAQAAQRQLRGDNSLSLVRSPHPFWWAVRLQSHLPEDWLRAMTQALQQPLHLP